MTVTYVGRGSETTVVSGSTTPLLPSGLAVGDLMLCVVRGTWLGAPSVTWPAGWTFIQKATKVDGSVTYEINVAFRVYEAGDSAPTVTFSSVGSAVKRAYVGHFTGSSANPRVMAGPVATTGVTSTSSPVVVHKSADFIATGAAQLIVDLPIVGGSTGTVAFDTGLSQGFASPLAAVFSPKHALATKSVGSGTITMPTYDTTTGLNFANLTLALTDVPESTGGLRLGKLHLNAARGLS